MGNGKPGNSKLDIEEAEANINNGSHKNLAALSIAALGVVFGDIGTSPLYAIRECFHGEYGIAATTPNILGVLSLIFWSLIIIVTVKYLTIIMRADNDGEGGVLALTFAAALLYGDGMITPAISVLSAVEGLKVITPFFSPYIILITVVILSALFLIQKRGTAGVGAMFGPVMIVWFSILAILGVSQIARHPQILSAVSPLHGIRFLLNNNLHGFLVLGAVFLVVTGTEALYADMGHFGTRPIRLTWFVIVFPSLLLNYFGQGALLLGSPDEGPYRRPDEEARRTCGKGGGGHRRYPWPRRSCWPPWPPSSPPRL